MYDQAYSVHDESQSRRSQAGPAHGMGPASRFKNHPSNSMSISMSSTVTCLICAKDTAAECEEEQLTGISTNALVSALSTIFDIPSSFYNDLNLHSLPTPLYCSVCSSLIFSSLEILNNIQSLQSNLDVLKSELKTNLIRSYDDMDDDPTIMASKPGADSDGGVAKEIIRQSLIQSWSEIDTDEDGGGTTYVSEENSDSLLGLAQDPISGSDLYTAEEIPEEDNHDGDVGNEDDDDNNCNMDFLDLQYEDEDRAEEESPIFSVVKSESRSQTKFDQHHQLNHNIPPNTTIFESDYSENGYENNRTHLKTEPRKSKLLSFKAKPRQRGRVKGFLRIRKHRQNVDGGRFPFSCGLCGKGYKKQRSFQMHLLCHREDSKKELLDKNSMIFKLEPERKPHLIQPQTIYDTEVSVVEDDLEESFQVDVNPTDISHANNYQDEEEPSTSSMISQFNLTNFPGVEISPAIIKIEKPSSESGEILNYRVRPNHTNHAVQGTSKSYFRPGGILKIRRNRQYRNSAYTCNFCGKAYSNYKSFVRHVKCHRRAGAGAVATDPQEDLDEAYKDRYRGIFRLSGRQRKGKFRYRCNHCGKGYRNAKSFEIHVQCHSGEYTLVKPKPPTLRQARIKTEPDIFSLDHYAPTSPAIENNSILPTITNPTSRSTSTSRALLASRRLKILSNNSKKQAASYKRQFRGILRIRNRNHGRSLPFKCNICGKGYKIARSFEKHIKFHTGELELEVKIEPKTKGPAKNKSKTKPKSEKIETPESENENDFSIETLNQGGNFVNELLNDGLHPTLFLSQSDPESEGHDQDDPPPPVPYSTTAPRRPGRGRPRVPGPKRRARGIFRIRNYGRIGNFPYRCKVCGKGYKNVKSYNTHVVFHREQGDCEVDEEIDEENPEGSLPLHLNSLEVTYADESSAQSKSHRTENSPSTSTSSNFLHGIGSAQQQQFHFCELCEKTFSSAPRLKAHMTYAHTTSYEYHCEKCDLGLPSRPALYQHMQGHLQERQEEKDFKSFTQRSGSGIMNSNPNPSPTRRHSNSNDCRYVCKICGDRFPQYVNLKEHSAVHEIVTS